MAAQSDLALDGLELPAALREALGRGGDGRRTVDVRSGDQMIAALEDGRREVCAHVVLRGAAEAEMAVRRMPDGLRICGCLVVAGADGAALAFPARLAVDGAAYVLPGRPAALSFGEGLRVGGTLDLYGCSGLLSLPESLHVGGDLVVFGCSGLRGLPENLFVANDANLFNCPALVGLPEGFRVAGDLNLGSCGALASLPANLHVAGQLSLGGCSALTMLPPGLRVGGSLIAKGCGALTSLPDGLEVGGHLDLSNCAALRTLVEGLRVGGSLDLDDCPSLTELPETLSVGGHLSLARCTAMQDRYADDVSALLAAVGPQGGLRLTEWTAIESLPDGLRVGGTLHLAKCTALASLPEGLRVGGTLVLFGCSALASLPDDLAVAGDLVLTQCSALTALPDHLQVGGDLFLGSCRSLQSLPASMLQWPVRDDSGKAHDVFLNGAGLSLDSLEWLRQAGAPGLRFHVDLDESDEEEGHHSGRPAFASATEAVAFWAKEAGLNADEYVAALEPFMESSVFVRFLSRLRDAKEFAINESRRVLARRVVAVIELIASGEDEASEELLLRMDDSLDACGDKPVWALNQMHLVAEIAKARKGGSEALRDLGRRVMRLMVVHEQAKRKVDSLKWVDDVCVYLRFEIELRESLDLPVDATAMTFPSYITVEDAELEAAKDDALGITDAQFEAWLVEWPEWQRQRRRDVVARLCSWENLPAAARPSESGRRRRLVTLSGEPMVDPVALNGSIWSMGDLLQHWERTGMDLHNSAVTPEQLKSNLMRADR